jgi:hypothetical protein
MAIDQDFVVRKGLIAQGQTQSYSTVSGTLVLGGGAGIGGNVNLSGTLLARINPNVTTSVNTATGFGFSLNDIIVTDSTTTSTNLSVANYVGQTSIKGTTGSVIATAVNLYIKGAPVAANSGTTIQNAWSLYVTTGSMYLGETKGNPFGASGNALQVAGGISAGNGLYVQGGGNLFGSFYLNDSEILTRGNQNTGTVVYNGDLIVDTSTQAISTGTGGIVIRRGGGIGVGGNAWIGGTLNVLNTATIYNVLDSSNTSTGALAVRGGVGIGGMLYATSGTFVSSLANVTSVNGNAVRIPNGGLGVGGTIYVANTSDSALTVEGGADFGGNIFANGLTLLDNTTATGYLSAPLMVTGGAYLGANLIVASTETDAIKVLGGIDVAKDITVRGIGSFTNRIEVANTSYISGAQIITTATVDIFAVTSLTAGTDTAVSRSTGPVVVWNTSTLDSVLGRGNATTNTVFINNTLTTVDLGVSGTATITGTVVILNTTQSISTESGALQVFGGVGIQGALWVNDASYIGGARIVTTSTLGNYGVTAMLAGTDTAINTTTGIVTVWNESTLQTITDRGTSTNHQLYFSNTASSTASDSGALTVAGGVGIGKELNVQGNSTFSSVVKILSPVNASGPTDGALYVAGGVGIGQDLYVGGQFVYTNALQVYGLLTNYGSVQINSTANSISTDTGALVVGGGAGFGGDIYARNIYANGGAVITTGTIGSYGVSQIYAGTDTAVNTATGLVYIWNTSTLQSITDRGATTTNLITILNTLSVANDVLVSRDVNVTGNMTLAAMTATGIINLENVSDSINVLSGAVRIAGGLGVQGNIYAGAVYDQNARVITTATVNTFAVTELRAGTDTAVSTSTGVVYVWNTSTLQTVTDRGNSTTNKLVLLDESTSSLTVVGGIIVGTTATVQQDLNVNNNLNVARSSNLSDVSISGITTVTNVTDSDSVLTGSVQLAGGLGVQGNIYARAIFDDNARVVTTATIVGLGVTNISAGTDTAVSTSTGVIVVWNTSTFQTVSDRGNTTTNAIFISNTLTVTDLNATNNLTVSTSATVGTLYANNTSYVNNAEIVTTATIAGVSVTKLTAGTDTVISTSTGEVTIWNNSTLQSVTLRGSTTDQAIRITNATPSGSYAEGALVVDGGVGLAGDLYVGRSAYITGNLVVLGTQTIVDSTSTSIVDPVLDIGTGVDNAPLILDDLLNKGVSVHYFNTGTSAEDNMFFGRDEPTGKFIVKHEYGAGNVLNPNYSTSGTYAGAILGNLLITDATSATSTYTGAFHVVGGGSVEKDFWIGGTAYIANAEILTTSTIGGFGVTNIQGGDDISVTTATGNVIISNTSTLQTVTTRGNSTTNKIVVLNSTESDDSLTGALTVTGGVGIGQRLNVGTTATAQDIYGTRVFDNGNRVVTQVEPIAGDSIGLANVQTNGTYTTFTINNLGVTATIGTTYLGVSSSTGAVTLYNLGVTNLVGTDYIGVSTSTGSVTLVNLGVQTLTAGTDTRVSSNTGTITVWNDSTLNSVASRGHTSTYAIDITNLTQSSNYTSGALTVAGGVGVGGSVYINNISFIQNAQIVTTATIDQFAVTDLRAGTDTSVSASHGIVTVWNTSTLQTVTDRGNSTTNVVIFANTTNVTTSLSTASVIIEGGLAIAKDLRIGGTFFYAGNLRLDSTSSSTSTDTGALVVTGGVGIGENLNVGGQVHLYSTASGTSTAALVVDGGISVANTSYFGAIYSGGSIVLTDSSFKGVSDIRAGTDTAVNTETGHIVVWNTSTFQTVSDRGNSTTNAIKILNTDASNDATSGALVVSGGVGVSGNIHAQTIFVNDTLQSDATDLYLASGLGGSVFANNVDLLAYSSKVWYVAVSGDNANDGRRVQSAFLTIKHALSVAQSGDVVFVESGTYSEIFPMTVPQGVTLKGAGLRAVIITPTGGTIYNTAFLLKGECNVCDLTITGFFQPGWAFEFAPGAKITTKSPYVERVSVITKGSATTGSDPYGFASGDAGNGALIDASKLDPTSLEPAMLWNEVTFIVPNATGMYMTNGARAELLNGFFYFAHTAIQAEVGTTGFGNAGKTRLKFSGVTGTFVGGDTLVYKNAKGQTLASGTIYSVSGGYVYLNGPVYGFETAIDRTPKTVTTNGGAKVATGEHYTGNSSLLLSTTTDYLEVLSGPDFQFGSTGDYTIEGWVKPLTTNSGPQYIYFKGTNGLNTTRLYIGSDNKVNAMHGSSVITSTSTIIQNVWTHLAIVRTGGTQTVDLYINGVLNASATGITSSVDNTDPINIGSNSGANGFTGYVDELRVSNIARYSTTFIPSPTGLVNDEVTVLMLHFEGTNNSTSFVDSGATIQNVYSTGLNPATATRTVLADYHQFGAELRCIGSAAVFGDRGVIANGTGTDLKLIAFNLSHIGSGGDLSDDVSLTVQSNEIIQTNGGKIYYQTVDQYGDFRVGDKFLINQRTGDVTFNASALNLNNISSLLISDGVNSTNITPGNIAVGNLNLGGNTIGSLTGNITIAPASTLTTIDSNLTVTGSGNFGQTSYAAGSQILTAATIGNFGVTDLRAGTDTAISTSTGNVTIWNTSTLQTITDRGFTTTNRVNIANSTNATTSTNGALTVLGGIGVIGDVQVGGNVYSGTKRLYSPNVTISLTAPTTATNNIGDFWIDPSIGVEYQWVQDGANYYWIQFTGV